MTYRYQQRPDMTRREQIRGMFQGCQQAGMVGPQALIVAVLAQAAIDAEDGDKSAREFFHSRVCRHYLTWLDLPTEWAGD